MEQMATFTDNDTAWEFAKFIGARPEYTVTDFGKINIYCYVKYTIEEK